MDLSSKLVSIAEKTPEVCAVIDSARKSASGHIVRVDDICPVEHDVSVKVRSKNLLAPSAFEALGFDMTNEECDYYAATAAPFFRKVIYRNTSGYTGQFRLSYQVKYISTNTSAGLTFVAVYTDGTTCLLYNKSAIFEDYYADGRVTDAGKVVDYISLSYGTGLAQTFFKDVQLEYGTTATAYTPGIDDFSSVTVTAMGKNLIPYPYATEGTRRGITFTPNADGTVTVNGQNDGTGTARLTFTHTNWDLPLGKYMMHSGHNVCIASAQILRANGSYNYASNMAFTLNEGDKITGMWIQVVAADKEVVFDNVIVKPQLECGTTATDYEPYKEPVSYIADTNGTVSGVKPIFPTTMLMSDTAGTALNCRYFPTESSEMAEKATNLKNALINARDNI